ncbi:hypothetical protein BDZ97DRAFT_1926616 [Flammula alnicola]|nr:hypothetical protein BDZ97DRAFT_1926616 [Flammula alnicola]
MAYVPNEYAPLQNHQFAPIASPSTSGSPSYRNEDLNHPSDVIAAQERASRRSVAGVTCLVGTLVICILLGMIVLLLAYLCVAHKCYTSKLALISSAPLGKVLTISQVGSHVATASVPIVMGLFSYLLGAQWLQSSSTRSQNRPSPKQLGLLLSICNGANISALFTSLKYLFRGKKSHKVQDIQSPPILRRSILLLALLLTVVYIATAADTWSHAVSQTIAITSNRAYSLSAIRNFGRAINATMCAPIPNNVNEGLMDQNTCGLINFGSGGSGATFAEGLRVVSNSSAFHRVVFTDDQIAILVPQNLPGNITYSAQTVGVKAHCTTVTKQCMTPMSNPDGSLDYGPDASLSLNCTKGGVKYYGNGTTQNGLCSLDSSGNCVSGWEIPSNPFTAGEVVKSNAYSDTVTEDTFDNNTGWFIHGNQGSWNVVFCNVTTLDVVYTYASSRYFHYSSSLTDVNSTQHIMTIGLSAATTAISYAVDGAGITSNVTYEDTYALELSRQMLARGAKVYETTDALGVEYEYNIIGTRLQLIPLVLFCISMVTLAAFVLLVILRTIQASRNVPYVHLAALYLKDPIMTVQRLYGHADPVLSWEDRSDKTFGEESEADRLLVGPALSGPHTIFAVTKG